MAEKAITLSQFESLAAKASLNGYSTAAFTIPVSSWKLENEKYAANISVVGLTAENYAEVFFDDNCSEIVSAAKISTEGETFQGGISITAENLPSDTVSGQLYIFSKESYLAKLKKSKVRDAVFTGATSSTAGTVGNVPAPLAGDQNKFLRGNGTWSPIADLWVKAVPTQANTVTYNGTPQQCNWLNYDPEKLIIDGDYEVTNAGEHTVGFTPREGILWFDDKTQDRRTSIFTIFKAAGVLTISANSGSVVTDDTISFTITTAGDGEVTVTSSDETVTTVRKNGNTVEITGLKVGTAIITVSQAEGTNYYAPISQTFSVSVTKRRIAIPIVTDVSKIYSGESQSPTVSNEPDSTYVSCTGKDGINADTYSLVYHLLNTDKCEWIDGSIDDKIFDWSIAKAECTIALSATSSETPRKGTSSFTITTPSDGTITVESCDTDTATVRLVGKNVTISGIANGTAIITVSQAEGTNHYAPNNVTHTTTVALIVSRTLNDNAWEIISEVSKAGMGDLYWNVGDCKQILLSGQIGATFFYNRLCVFILDFNHPMNGVAENNIIWGGFKTALNNGHDVVLYDSQYAQDIRDGRLLFNMYHYNTEGSNAKWGMNYGGWKGTDLRYDILGATSTPPLQYLANKDSNNVGYDATQETLTNPKEKTLLAALPSDLRSVIRLWTRYVDATGSGSVYANIKPTVDAITLLAESEVFSTRVIANQYEKNYNKVMAYYANGNSAVRYFYNSTVFDGNNSPRWWFCSPDAECGWQFCAAQTGYFGQGSVGQYSIRSQGIGPAFKT